MPLVGNIVQDLTKEMLNPGNSTTTTTNRKRNMPSNRTLSVNITPEMIKTIQDAMKK